MFDNESEVPQVDSEVNPPKVESEVKTRQFDGTLTELQISAKRMKSTAENVKAKMIAREVEMKTTKEQIMAMMNAIPAELQKELPKEQIMAFMNSMSVDLQKGLMAQKAVVENLELPELSQDKTQETQEPSSVQEVKDIPQAKDIPQEQISTQPKLEFQVVAERMKSMAENVKTKMIAREVEMKMTKEQIMAIMSSMPVDLQKELMAQQAVVKNRELPENSQEVQHARENLQAATDHLEESQTSSLKTLAKLKEVKEKLTELKERKERLTELKEVREQAQVQVQKPIEKINVVPTWMTFASIFAGLYVLMGETYSSPPMIWILTNTILIGSSFFEDDKVGVNSMDWVGLVVQVMLILSIPLVFYFGVGDVFWPFMIMIGVKAWNVIGILLHLHAIPSDDEL
jgi:myosin heavy subunit